MVRVQGVPARWRLHCGDTLLHLQHMCRTSGHLLSWCHTTKLVLPPACVLPCRYCGSKAGYQPFGGASSVSFAMRDDVNPGKAPPVQLQLTNPDTKKACNAKVLS